jgi:hypothetical protein
MLTQETCEAPPISPPFRNRDLQFDKLLVCGGLLLGLAITGLKAHQNRKNDCRAITDRCAGICIQHSLVKLLFLARAQ